MSANEDTDTKTSYIFTDIDKNPITCDNNPARFDGFLLGVVSWGDKALHTSASCHYLTGP